LHLIVLTLLKGRLTSQNDVNLVICKNILLEIYRVTKEGLKFVRQISLWGVVENLKIIKAKVCHFFHFCSLKLS
jgi:hypothetical protein